VESSCEFGIGPAGSMKCWETIEWLTSSGHSISVQLHIGPGVYSASNRNEYQKHKNNVSGE
jgi:hypothetical protein